MRVLRYRQLFIPLFAVAFQSMALLGEEPATAVSEAMRELQAAKLLQTTLSVRGASEEEWAKLDEIYAGLAKRYPREPAMLHARAEMLWERGEQDRAERLWRDALALDPKNAVLLHQLGVCALAEGKAQEAAAFYQQAVTESPETALYHFNLANVLYLFRHELLDARHADAEAVIGSAMEHYATASRLAPQNAEYSKAYAETFFGLAKPDWNIAAEAWKQYIGIAANKDFGYANLARVFLKAGKKPEAREALNQMTTAEFAPLKKRLAERIERE